MKRGLTLIEVLLAVTILGFSLTVLLTAASRCLAVIRFARIYPVAQWTLAMGELDHPLRPVEDLKDLEVAGEDYPGGFAFVRTVDDDEDDDGLHVVRTRVTWSDRERQPYEEVVQYLYQKKK